MESKLKENKLLIKLLKIIDESIDKKNLMNIVIDHELLKRNDIIDKFRKLIPELKRQYNSNMLNCLHKNSVSKQKFPAVNMLRQILKCNDLKLVPFVICNGYNKANGRKIVIRKYKIEIYL